MDTQATEPSEVEPLRSLFASDLERLLLDGVDVHPGDTVLELASGMGALCVRLANRVRPGGRTICSDIRPERVAAVQELVAGTAARDIDVRQLDMLRLQLPDASVDGILCRWGLMYAVPEAEALREAIRVLRPGRRLVVAVWAEAAVNPWISLIDAAILDAGLEVPDDRQATGRMFSLGRPGTLDRLISDAGFDSVKVVEVPLSWAYASFEAFWDEEGLIAGPFEQFFGALERVQLRDVQDRLRAALAAHTAKGGGYRIPGVTLVASGRRPST